MTHDAVYLREACRVAALESQDPRTQNGALLRARNGIVITAANQLPSIVPIRDRLHTDAKYAYLEHAERHVIYKAARAGIATHDATLYCPWFACADCARAIILAGISRVVGHAKARALTPERWQATIATADTMLHEVGVELLLLDESLGTSFLFNGQLLEL
jgi:dCMP deaminase